MFIKMCEWFDAHIDDATFLTVLTIITVLLILHGRRKPDESR